MKKLMFITGVFDVLLAILLVFGGVQYVKAISGLGFDASISTFISSISIINIVLLGIVTLYSIFIFVVGLYHMTNAIDTSKVTRTSRVLLNTANLSVLGGIVAFNVLYAITVGFDLATMCVGVVIYYMITALCLITMLVLIILGFAKLPKRIRPVNIKMQKLGNSKIKKQKIKKQKNAKVQMVEFKPSKVKIEKQQVLKAEEPKKVETKENIVQPNFNFRKRR